MTNLLFLKYCFVIHFMYLIKTPWCLLYLQTSPCNHKILSNSCWNFLTVSCWEPSSLKLLFELLNDLTQKLLQDLCSPPLHSPLLWLGILNSCWRSLEILFSQSSPTRHISLATCTNSLSFLMCIPHPNPAYFIFLFSPLDSLPYCLSASTLDQREWNKSFFYLHLICFDKPVSNVTSFSAYCFILSSAITEDPL